MGREAGKDVGRRDRIVTGNGNGSKEDRREERSSYTIHFLQYAHPANLIAEPDIVTLRFLVLISGYTYILPGWILSLAS